MSLSSSVGRVVVENILQKKKNWLKNKVEEIRTSYADTLGAIREELDNCVTEPINVANGLLDRPENALSLVEIATAGNMLQESNKYLFDILLAVCSLADHRPNQDRQHNVMHALQLLPVASHPIARQQREAQIISVSADEQLGADYMQLEATSLGSELIPRTSLRYSSESEAGAFEPLPLPAINQNNNNEDDCDLESPVFENLPPLPVSPKATASTDEASAKEAKQDESCTETLKGDNTAEISETERASSKELYDSYSSDETYLSAFRAGISDVVSPHSFSIQPEENKPAIEKLQKELNQFYDDEKGSSDLVITSIPRPGDYCAVVFQQDNNWYRARVVQLTSQSSMLVEYVDYGNVDEVLWRSAYKLHSVFTHLPQQSIHCSLAEVKPVKSRNKGSDDQAKWDEQAIDWFDKLCYGKTYQVVPVQSPSGPMSCKLLFVEESDDQSHVVRSVADLLVKSGHAEYDDETEEKTPTVRICQKALEKIKKHNGEEESTHASMKTCASARSCKVVKPLNGGESGGVALPNLSEAKRLVTTCSGNCRSNASNRSRSTSCIPAGMERTYHMMCTPPKTRTPTPELPVCHVAKSSLLAGVENEKNVPVDSDGLNVQQEDLSAQSPRQSEDEKTKDEEKRLTEWDPMAEDYNSIRNNYGVDDENACMVTEGFDPEKLVICRHYIRGRCWNGDQCPNIHPQRKQNGELKNEVPTFCGSSLVSLDMVENSWSIVRLTTVKSSGNFYVQVIKQVADMQECVKFARLPSLLESSVDLANLMTDMRQQYSQGSRRAKDLMKPALGEMYAVNVPEENCFYRGMITEVFVSSGYGKPIKVHLVDFGRDVAVLETYLHPMCQAFMHLPKQAVLCSLWDGKLSDFRKLQALTTTQGVTHLAMKVRRRGERTDGPIQVTLYKMDKDGLHHFPTG